MFINNMNNEILYRKFATINVFQILDRCYTFDAFIILSIILSSDFIQYSNLKTH